jgi:hypothetical protein
MKKTIEDRLKEEILSILLLAGIALFVFGKVYTSISDLPKYLLLNGTFGFFALLLVGLFRFSLIAEPDKYDDELEKSFRIRKLKHLAVLLEDKTKTEIREMFARRNIYYRSIALYSVSNIVIALASFISLKVIVNLHEIMEYLHEILHEINEYLFNPPITGIGTMLIISVVIIAIFKSIKSKIGTTNE